jgi:hypothetical protein
MLELFLFKIQHQLQLQLPRRQGAVTLMRFVSCIPWFKQQQHRMQAKPY